LFGKKLKFDFSCFSYLRSFEMEMSRRHTAILLASSVLLPLSLQAQAQISAAVAINRAARFRALSQRSVKLHAQLVLDVMPQASRETIEVASKLMQLGLDDLGKAQLKGNNVALLGNVSERVNGLRAAMAGTPSRETLQRTNAAAGLLLADAERLTVALESTAGQSSARLIGLAGRQRMLSQRMAKNYMLTAAGLDSTASRAELAQDRQDFVQALVTLSGASVSTQPIRNEIQLAQAQWTFFETSLNRKPDAEALKTVATTSERLLEVSDNLTNLYEVALRDALGNT
jgi:hypothetical protein